MNTFTASFNTTVRQMTEMSEQPKDLLKLMERLIKKKT